MHEPPPPPLAHQQRDLDATWHRRAYGILWEQGTGKTRLAIDTAARLYQTGEIDAVFVVAPSGVHLNWKTDELPKHLPTELRGQSLVHCYQTAKAGTKRHASACEELLRWKKLAWLLMSYDGIMTERGRAFAKRFLTRRRCLQLLDESHHIKSPGAKRTKRLVASGAHAQYRRVMTGTMVAQGPFDVYSQIRFLEPTFWHERGIGSFLAFKHRYGVWRKKEDVLKEKGYDPGYDLLLGYKNVEELNRFLEPITSRVLKEDVLDLPPKLYTRRYHELTAEQQRHYEELVDEYRTELDCGLVVDAALAIVRLLRLQQVVCGYLPTGEALAPLSKKNLRLELLMETLEELGPHPAIIWARFTQDIDLICDRLGDRAVRYDGQVSSEAAAANKARFQSGEVQFFVGNPQKGKEGLTLTQARAVVYYSNSFRLLDRVQSEDRAHRYGQEHSVTYVDLVAQGTVDEYIIRALRAKFDVAAQVNGDYLRAWI